MTTESRRRRLGLWLIFAGLALDGLLATLFFSKYGWSADTINFALLALSLIGPPFTLVGLWVWSSSRSRQP